ncbi:MAG: hypothetical protein DHS20C01_10070 [marine bacterium B5-7]|nr:MAG: hypothetical protein DHS20C01_10070 [marine bacterium B5-7]
MEKKARITPQPRIYPAYRTPDPESLRYDPLAVDEKDWFECIFELSSIGMVVSTPSGRFLRVNQAFCDWLGYSREEIMSENVIVSHEDDKVINFEARELLKDPAVGAISVEKRYVRKDGSVVRAEMHVTAQRDRSGQIERMITQVVDLDPIYIARDAAVVQAHTDALTGLPNRRELIAALDLQIAQAITNNAPLALIMLDIDRFKSVNDTLGHVIGDKLLIHCASRIRQVLDSQALLTRMSGDEFAIIVNNTNRTQAVKLAQTIAEQIAMPFQIDQYSVNSSASLGLACVPEDADNLSDLIRRADLALLRSKSNHSAVFSFTPELDVITEAWHAISQFSEPPLDTPIRFEVQPVIDIEDGIEYWREALVRVQWNDSLLSPEWFIPVAELSGTISHFDEQVLNLLVRNVLSGVIESPIAFNVSAISLGEPQYAKMVLDLLERTGLPATSLILELTESAELVGIDNALNNARLLRQAGLKIALDDWGSGNTSFAAMRLMPYDILKIDASLIHGIGHRSQDELLIRHVISMGREAGFDVIAEGVEDRQQVDWLIAHGCRLGQGYFLKMPRLIDNNPKSDDAANM